MVIFSKNMLILCDLTVFFLIWYIVLLSIEINVLVFVKVIFWPTSKNSTGCSIKIDKWELLFK